MAWSRRTLRAFVSSTYRDLKATRRLVGDQLVATGVLPVGMEIFPAAGQGPWEVIRSGIDSSDFYLLIVGGRYGSLAPAEVAGCAGRSWTHAEYSYARSRHKPIVALVHADPDSLPRELVDDRDSPIWAFRDELQRDVLARLYRDDADLISGLHLSLLHLREAENWEDAKPARQADPPETLDEYHRKVYDRRYELVSANWSFSESVKHQDRWDGVCRIGRAVRPHWPEGLAVFSYQAQKPTEDFDCFHEDDPPSLELLDWERSEAGRVVVRDRHRRMNRGTYVHDVDFQPSLRRNELCTFRLLATFPGFKCSYRDDVLAATARAAAGSRDFEITSFTVNYPTERLVLSAFLPSRLGATSLGFGVRKNGISMDDDECDRVRASGYYGNTDQSVDGVAGTVITLDVPRPVMKRTYELRWKPPKQPN